MIEKKIGSVAWALAVACLFLIPSVVRAEIDPGVRGGFYSDAESGFIGVELLWDVTREWYFNPNLEYVFIDNGDLSTLNLDFHYDFNTNAPFYLWAGGGPALVFRSTEPPRFCPGCEEDDETNVGLNLLGGVGFGRGEALRPYIQGKVLVSDETEAVLAVGIRFH